MLAGIDNLLQYTRSHTDTQSHLLAGHVNLLVYTNILKRALNTRGRDKDVQ